MSSGAPAGRQDRHLAKTILLLQVNESLVDFETRDWLEQKQGGLKSVVSNLGLPTSKHWLIPGSFARFRHLRDYSLRRNTNLRIPFNNSHATNQKYRFVNVWKSPFLRDCSFRYACYWTPDTSDMHHRCISPFEARIDAHCKAGCCDLQSKSMRWTRLLRYR